MINRLVPNLAQRVFGTLLLIATFALFIYSYGFIDFNLTLSSNPVFLNFIAPLQHLVYFDRSLSAQIYIGIFFFLTLIFTGILEYWNTGILKAFPWKLFLLIIGILVISYPMLSYDVFNYMFHGKILWFYHANPHTIAPQEFTNDLWLRFMRWVHTPSAYGPIFTTIESPAYLLGLGKFVPTLYLMKATMAAFFVWSVYLIGRIGTVRSQLLLAFNPFLLLELVVNAHNDAVMIALLLFALFFLQHKKTKLSLLSLALSIGVKYVTALALPLFIIRDSRFKIYFITLILLLPVLFSPGRFQPWYLVWSLIPAALINTSWSRLWVILASLAGLIYYIPFVATGFWNNSIPFVSLILYTPVVITMLYFFSQKSNGSNHRTNII
jgi:hypothetical protein